MFSHAETDPVIDKDEARELEADLRIRLLQHQYRRLQQAEQTLLIVVAGIDGAGKGSAINLLNTWMDPRHVHTLAFGKLNKREAMRPAMWRYWNSLPPKGQTGIVFGSWYGALLAEAQRKHPDTEKMAQYARIINRFEAMLAAEGVQVVKLWFHLSREAHKERTERLLQNPETAWRVSRADLKAQKRFHRLRRAGEIAITQTLRPHAPWYIIPSANDDTRAIHTADAVLQALEQPPATRIVADTPLPVQCLPAPERRAAPPERIGKDVYEAQLAHWQGRIAQAMRSRAFSERSLVLVFEGQDAAGKGGAIRRITAALDVRSFDIHPVSAPNAYERSRPYLWRFWRKLPPHGKIAIFDRSWYGRVLVERVERLATPATWQRAYDEINDFEAQLCANGTQVLKFWLEVSKAEQLRRFKERETSPFKSFKLTQDDWRNRTKWNAYRNASQSMLERTSTHHAPWHCIPADDKRMARLKILEAVATALESADGHEPAHQEPPIQKQTSEFS
ncbi:polyphosphate:AMP phosphotransferase [Paracandidimonas soli]|uniref:Polyphosphate:AMP phosphotransferase n=2 Tax=Paracandidimonas soli TaxID=1917182 RepID=A0A4R3UQ15_9BURK|nr:polyphosphate:AMP phosphotransferase [Paracandidimonas soli]TCU93895.1 polyphosphate:AMP phosphotransferase [Paracandidimonas soli]